MITYENPCQACPDNCCSIRGLFGLLLSKDEFADLFKKHEQQLNVRKEDQFIVISSKENAMCPHFYDGGCKIYLERPIDCRLYPYQMRLAYETKGKAKFVLHSRSDCPRKANLLLPEEEARKLIKDFGRNVFGDKKIIVQNTDHIFSRLMIKIEIQLVKFFKGLGIVK